MKSEHTTIVAGDIFLGCIPLASSLPLLAGFAVESLLAVSLCELADMQWGVGDSW